MSDNVQYGGENLYDVPCQVLIFRKIINIDLYSLNLIPALALIK